MNAFIASVFLGIIDAGYVMYFVDSLTWTLLIGAGLLAAPFVIVL